MKNKTVFVQKNFQHVFVEIPVEAIFEYLYVSHHQSINEFLCWEAESAP